MIVVVLGKRKIWSFQIDEEDWGRVRGFRWHVDSLGYVAKLLNLPKARKTVTRWTIERETFDLRVSLKTESTQSIANITHLVFGAFTSAVKPGSGGLRSERTVNVPSWVDSRQSSRRHWRMTKRR
jgi:hypothetical protein